ncbi:TIGR03747 family integrating conjugative element membrane protein [Pseudomonas corrugata]|uniref:TIGR03747 family integrating conjugative element membrane protein n=1 Tax=Pseudomonas corrugata TaxID=47879 RepID=UPI0015861C64|nr:TIGR03747 family integrating conjugative element membrane protein [Pseudomonas corrugata]MCI0997766.1 TIGR03747 family integrating conjugative element membrane protein [Pseudomonas corrugata]NUT69437.1 TIGR03747 family integrating conjugative element membrane protein [Pseudomonas corrugata]
MSGPTASAQHQQRQQQGLFINLLTLPFRFVAVLLGSLLLNIVIECIGMYVFWPEEGWRHSQQMFEYELVQLSTDFKRSALVQEPGRSARKIVQFVYDEVLVSTGIAHALMSTSQRAQEVRIADARSPRDYIAGFYSHLENNLIAAAFSVLIFIVRLLVLFLSVPLFLVAAFIGLIDGLVQRDIRRFGAGRESGYVYHRAKACMMPLLTFPWVIYLALPVSVNASFILLPCAALLGGVISLTASRFKKYL